jgi:hypothetical protein
MKIRNTFIAASAMVFCSIGNANANQGLSQTVFALPAEKDPCKEAFYEFESRDITLKADKSGTAILVNLKLSEKSGKPSAIKMVVGLTDCKGNEQFVSVELKFNEKTGLWTGAEYLFASSECPFTVSTYRVIAVNPCGDEYDTGVEQDVRLKNGGGKLPARDRIIARRRRGQ